MRIVVYNSSYKEVWDDFVKNAKNGTFLFYRDFMEYHSDRFKDYSLLFFADEELVAIMPGHIDGRSFCTHNGLTYGGLVMSMAATAEIVLEIFDRLVFTFKQQGFNKIIYKAIPHIYHKYPAEEDLYALFRQKATILERNISSTIQLTDKKAYSRSRKKGIKKALDNDMRVECSIGALQAFWSILELNLQSRYGKKPVHSLDEMAYLREKFPENIHLYVVKSKKDEVEAGCVVFEMERLVHVQYSASSEVGKSIGAMDLLIDKLIYLYSERGKKYFDYGISNEEKGQYLNEKLIYQKEGFGGRGVVYDVYIINI